MTPAVSDLAEAVACLIADPAFADRLPNTGRAPEPWLTAEQVGELLGGLPAKTITRYAREGRLRSHPVGRRPMFRRSEVDSDVVAGRLAA